MRHSRPAISRSSPRAPAYLAVVALVAAFLPPVAAAAPSTEAERGLRAAVEAFGRAFVAGDVPTLRSLLAEGYVHVNGGSGEVLGREEWLAWVAARHGEIERGELVVESYVVEGLELRLHGAAAAVTGIVHSTGVRGGARFATRLRFTQLWVEQRGAWRRAAFHDSPLSVPDAQGSAAP